MPSALTCGDSPTCWQVRHTPSRPTAFSRHFFKERGRSAGEGLRTPSTITSHSSQKRGSDDTQPHAGLKNCGIIVDGLGSRRMIQTTKDKTMMLSYRQLHAPKDKSVW